MDECPFRPSLSADDSESLGLDKFAREPEDGGLSLDKLSAAFAEMLNTGDDPYAPPAEEEDVEPAGGEPRSAAADRADISPRTILEALLFVGSPRGEPLTSQQVAGLMRGVRPAEIDGLVVELNAQYDARRCPYRIVSEGSATGSRAGASTRMRDKFYGRARQARLSQAAIEVLGGRSVSRPAHRRGDQQACTAHFSGHILTQLVRRQLLIVERPERKAPGRYSTTPRFLELFGLRGLEDLPRSEDMGETQSPIASGGSRTVSSAKDRPASAGGYCSEFGFNASPG